MCIRDRQTTKCEFIQILEGQAFTGEVKHIYGGLPSGFSSSGSIYDDTTPVVLGASRSNPKAPVLGTGNNIGNSVTNSLIVGNSNNVLGGKGNVLLNSSGDTIMDGLKNVTLINTNDVTITSGDITFINNAPLPALSQLYSAVKRVTSATKTYNPNPYDSSVFVETGATNTVVNLPTTYIFAPVGFTIQGVVFNLEYGRIMNIKKTDSGVGNVIITPVAPALIDGAATAIITSKYDSLTVQYDGTNWHII